MVCGFRGSPWDAAVQKNRGRPFRQAGVVAYKEGNTYYPQDTGGYFKAFLMDYEEIQLFSEVYWEKGEENMEISEKEVDVICENA